MPMLTKEEFANITIGDANNPQAVISDMFATIGELIDRKEFMNYIEMELDAAARAGADSPKVLATGFFLKGMIFQRGLDD